MNKTDIKILKRGFKRAVLSLLAAALTAASFYGFITVPNTSGYRAVITFWLAMVAAYGAFVLFYILGRNLKASVKKVDHK